jgi:hypothetical protein
MLTALLLPFVSQAQVNTYLFSTGVDNTKWYTFTSDSTVLKVGSNNDSYATAVTNIGFTFTLSGVDYTQFSVNSDGTMRLGSTVVGMSNYTTPFSTSNASVNTPKICGLGCDGYLLAANDTTYADYIAYQLFGTEGNHVLVVEVSTGTYSTATRGLHYKFQIQLAEADGSITLMYSPVAPAAAPAVVHQLGVGTGANDFVLFDNTTHTMQTYTAGTTTTNAAGTWPDAGRYYTISPDPNACYAVSALEATNVTTTEVTLAWNDAGNSGATYSIVGDNGSVVASGLTAMTYTVTGLTANTSYTFGVVAHCSADHSSSATTITVQTPCEAVSVPYSENFDDLTTSTTAATGVYVPCWNFTMTGSSTYQGATYQPKVYYGTTQANSGSYSLRLYGNSYTCLPPVNEPLSGLQLTFSHYTSGASYKLVVGVMEGNTFVPIDTMTTATSTHTPVTVYFSDYTGSSRTIAFCNYNTSATTYYSYHYIDDVVVDYVPSCLPVRNLTASNITSSSITLNWNDNVNTGATYSILGADGSVVATGISDMTYTVTGLTPNTTYTFGVVAHCSASDASTAVTISVLTSCGEETMPWSENFDNWTAKSPCWQFLSGQLNGGAGTPTTSSSAWTLNTSYGSYITISGKALTMNLYSTNRYWAVTPYISITSNDALLSVDVAVSAWSAETPNYDDNDTLAFAVSTDGTTWTVLRVVDYMELNAMGGTYTTVNVPVTGYNGQNVRFAIYGGSVSGTSPHDNRIAIDNVTVDVAPGCMPPAALSVSAIGTNSATLTWTGNATSYNVYALGADGSITLVQNVATPTITLSGLTAMTQYTYGVRCVCGSEESSMITVTFNTACSAVAIPFTENFETSSATLGCWTMDEGDGAWIIGTGDYSASTGAYEGTGNAKITHSSTGNVTKLVSPAFDGVVNGMTVSFAYVMRAWSSDIDELRVYSRSSETADWQQISEYTTAAATWTLASVNIPGTVYQVAFEYTDNYGYGVGIDNVSFTEMNGGSDTTGSDTTGTCMITILAGDGYGDGWGDATLTVSQNGATLLSYSMADQNVFNTQVSETVTVSVNGSLPVVFSWNDGDEDYNDEVSFSILDGGGATVYTVADGSLLSNGVIFTLNNACPSCLMPNVVLDTVTTTTATISWTGNASSYSIYNGNTFVASTTGNTYTFTGLTAAMSYNFGVVAVCSATDSSSMATIAVRTDCANGGCELTVVTGPYGLLGAGIEVKQNGLILGVLTEASQAQATLTISVCSGVPVELNYMQTPYAAYGYDELVSFTIYDGGGAVVYTCTDGSTMTEGHMTLINNPCPSCVNPVVTVGATTVNSITINWTGTASSYSIYNGTTYVTTVNANTYTFTGLTAATAYTFGVVALCSATDSSSMATVTVSTACDDITTLPYYEGFENGLVCWTSVNGSADGVDWNAQAAFDGGSVAPHTGSYAAASWSWNNSAMHANAWLISPKFILPNTGDSITFTWWERTNSSYPDSYSIAISTTTDDTTAFTTIVRPYGVAAGTWTMQSVDLTSYAGQNMYVAFHHVDYDANYLMIDDIALSAGAFVPPAPDTLTVTFAVNNATMGTTNPIPGAYQYLTGDTVRFSAVPNAGYRFVGWEMAVGTDVDTIGAQYISAYVPADAWMSYGAVTLTALFEAGNPDSTVITYAVNDATMGTTVPAPGTYTIYVGNSIQVEAVANSGYQLDAWVFDIYLAGVRYSSDTIYSDDSDFDNPMNFGSLPQNFVDAGATITITALFVPAAGPTTYTVIVRTSNGEMGNVNPMGVNTVVAGESFTVTATPNTGYHFVNWTSGTDVVSTENPYTFTVTEDIALIANFEANDPGVTYYELRVTSENTDMCTVSCSVPVGQVAEGTEVTVTATAAEGYRFVNWLSDAGIVVSTDNPYTFTLTENVALIAIFEAVTGIEDIETSDFNAYSIDNRIVVKGVENMSVNVYDVNGRSVKSIAKATETIEFTVPSTGVYLVKAGNAPAKRVVVVR